MKPLNLEQLEQLSEQIREAELSVTISKLAATFDNDNSNEKSPDEIWKQTEEEKSISIFLRSLRIHMCLDLIKAGYSSCKAQFSEDWNEVVECLKFIRGEWKVTKELISDAVDIILLLDLSKRDFLIKQLDFQTRLKVKAQTPLSPTVYFRAIRALEYCLSNNRKADFLAIVQNIISISEIRNKHDIERHRELVRCTVRYIVDVDYNITCHLCNSQQCYFEGITDFDASRFYWYYAFALIGIGNTKEALPLLEHCQKLCLQVEGDNSWIGARAGHLYHCVTIYQDQSSEAEAFLWDLLQKIDDEYYPEMDSSSGFVGAFTRSVLLKYNMERQTLRHYYSEIMRFRDYCYEHDAEAVTPRLTIRYAENLLSSYYLETGELLQAAEHSRKALASLPPSNIEIIPKDIIIYTNLLLIYSSLNDTDQMIRYYELLVSELNDYTDDRYIQSRASLVLNTAEKKLGIHGDSVKDDRQFISDLYNDISNGNVVAMRTATENTTYALWVLDQASSVLDTFECDLTELHHIHAIITYFLDNEHVYSFNDVQKMVCYSLLAQVTWQEKHPDAEYALDQTLRYSNSVVTSNEARISTLRFAAIVYYTFGKTNKYLPVIEEALACITSAWQKATAYLNDQKICQLLSFVQQHFNVCYGILRTAQSSDMLYETVLRYKDLPSLVGRERNKLLRLTPVDEELRDSIFVLQDKLAAAELNDSLQGTTTALEIAEQLQSKEALFAEQFPQNVFFTDISFEGVCQKLPDDSAIVEYYFVLGEESLGKINRGNNHLFELDVFVTSKTQGKICFNHLRIPAGDSVLDITNSFVEILQDPDDLSRAGEKDALRSKLYDTLLVPVMPYLSDVSTLYIAPDDQLCNLPFEILYNNESGLLQDRFTICRLVCGRDILFYDDQQESNGGCFILGGPNYEAEKGETSKAKERGVESSLVPVDALPFSGLEARRVARRCRVEPFIGNDATKFALQEALPCRIIHIATHGVFDEETEIDALYSAQLVFAGYNKWVSHKTESSGCGNGILTADEISRMDLHKTDLVVLSACQTGLGDTSYRSTRGLISAFSAAGARWIICHMWEASDFATPILMDAFYYAHLNLCMEVPEALQYAKNYLRGVTVGDLLREGWLDIPNDLDLPIESQEEILALRNANMRRRPFEDEFYWGGFTVHKSR